MKIRHSFVSNSSSSSFVISFPYVYSHSGEMEAAIKDMVKSLEDAYLILPEEDRKYETTKELERIDKRDAERINKYTEMIKSGRKVIAVEVSNEDGPAGVLEVLESHGIMKVEEEDY